MSSNSPPIAPSHALPNHAPPSHALLSRSTPNPELAEAIELSEALERDCLRDLWRGAPAATRAALGWEITTRGEAWGMVCHEFPEALMTNRIMGSGGVRDVEQFGEDALALVRDHSSRDSMRWLVQPPPLVSDAAFEQRLAGLGLVPFRRRWAKFVRGRAAAPRVATTIDVQVVSSDTVRPFAELLVSQLGLPAALSDAYCAAATRPEWACVVAMNGGRVIGSGAMFICNRVAYMAGGATLPDFRGRGVQGALMATRIGMALDSDCRWLVAETGEAVDGEPNHSFGNLLRHGFEVVCSRANFVALAGAERARFGARPSADATAHSAR